MFLQTSALGHSQGRWRPRCRAAAERGGESAACRTLWYTEPPAPRWTCLHPGRLERKPHDGKECWVWMKDQRRVATHHAACHWVPAEEKGECCSNVQCFLSDGPAVPLLTYLTPQRLLQETVCGRRWADSWAAAVWCTPCWSDHPNTAPDSCNKRQTRPEISLCFYLQRTQTGGAASKSGGLINVVRRVQNPVWKTTFIINPLN